MKYIYRHRLLRELVLMDGPRKFMRKRVRETGSTMDDVRLDNGTWVVYDRVGRDMYVVGVKETGMFVAGSDGISFGAHEVFREKYEGVL